MARVRITVGGDQWEADLGRLLNVEVMAVERQTGMTATEFEEALNRNSFTALTALLWVLRRRSEPGLAFDAVVFESGDFGIEPIKDEVAEGKDEASPEATAST